MKVYAFNYDGRRKLLGAANSMAAFHRKILAAGASTSMYHLREYCSETRNEHQCKLALENPDVVFIGEMTFVDPKYEPFRR